MRVHYGHLIRILHWCTDQTMTDALNKLDLTAAQGRLMAFLAHRGDQPTYAKDVEAEFHLSHPTVSGLASHERLHRAIAENESRIVQGFSEEEKVRFAEYLQRAIDNVCPDNGCQKGKNTPSAGPVDCCLPRRGRQEEKEET